ncbi:hypothetical protein B0I00_3319 [Novosphingobium kunmingense]|uniref:AtuA-like ferredoxin-fold domain-containing protein n=1 Tax=Novosphingobium kunmingense TaxID=1211806 RepID=A0A2N0H3L1_9SPHN|nr:hypothetical protein [Novosphingobium kunmingense]PKB13517.1 hypothetical protein B0I00_3319 [Novosphingobium kunmingense]
MLLSELAHVRSGDKGDTSQISVIAYRLGDYPLLAEWVTADRVAAHFPGLACRRVSRFELPGIGALNFVLEGAMPGGVTRTLALDAHGKTLAMQLLSLDIPDDLP